ncbi:MAG: sodium-dependent transporter [Candidatus Aerophobetes bacterium]|nr:sodium-dependent transporter [Candidatus Aerophobetes bacterium]
MASKETSSFTSRWGLLMTALGAAVGTGNIWRFPKEVANNGGGSFMIPYVLFLFGWSIPILVTEFSIGKKTRLGTMGSFAAFLGKKKAWMGGWLAWVTVAIGFYYAVVMGWTIRYAYGALNSSILSGESQAVWDSFISSPWLVIFFQVLAIGISAFVVLRGLEKGVEKVNLILIPTLFVLLVFNAVWALSLPGAMKGVAYLFTPHGDTFFSAKTWVSALAQSAWSCSAGMGMGITFGAYTKRKGDTSLNSFLTGLGNTTVSLVAGIMIFSTVFALSPNVIEAEGALEQGGAGLTFIHLPRLFGQIGGFGVVVAFFFFLAMAFAALTSMISTYENAVKNFIDLGWSRKKATWALTFFIFLLGIPSAVIVLPVMGTPLPVFLENQDFVWGMGLIVSGAFIYYLIYKYGIEKFRVRFVNGRFSDQYIGKWYTYLFKYIIPLELALLVGWFVIQSLMAEPLGEWWMGGPIGLGLLLVQWIMILIFLVFINRKVEDRIDISDIDMERSVDEDIDIIESREIDASVIEEPVASEV